VSTFVPRFATAVENQQVEAKTGTHTRKCGMWCGNRRAKGKEETGEKQERTVVKVETGETARVDSSVTGNE
jgi:hypothetical protein